MSARSINIDWCDLATVIALCQELHSQEFPQMVIKVPGRKNYNITFQSHARRYDPEWIVWKPEGSRS